jgi:nucleotide-binding universal stress UspA family protein
VILVGIDARSGAADALALGRRLSEACQEDLLLAWVHPWKALPSLLDDGPDVEQVRAAVEELAEAVRNSLPADLRPELQLLSGRSPAEALERLGGQEQASIIVVGPSERAGLGRVLPGRTGVRLLSGSRIPVAIAPRANEEQPQARGVIGVGYDGGSEAAQALEWAVALARRVDAEVRLIAVHESVPYARVGTTLPTESVSQVLRSELRDQVAAAVEPIQDVSVDVIYGEGDAAAFLAEQSDVLDLLVLGSRGYGPVRSVLLGSISEAAMSASRSPVLVIPRGHAAEVESG